MAPLAALLSGLGRAGVAANLGRGAAVAGAVARKVAKRGAKGAVGAVKEYAASEAFQEMRKNAIRSAPRAIFRAAGGDRIPILGSMFNHIEDQIGKGAAGDRERQELKDKQDKLIKKADKQRDEDLTFQRIRDAEEKTRESIKNNEERQRRAHAEGTALLQKDQNHVMVRMADDIHDIKGILDNQSKQNAPEKGGGILGALGGIASSVVGALALSPLGAKILKPLGRGAAGLGRAVGRGLGGIGRAARSLGSSIATSGRAGVTAASGLAGLGAEAATAATPTAAKALGKTGAGVTAASGLAGLGAEAATAATPTAAKALGKTGAKTVGKALVKKIPVIGLLAGIGFAASRAAKGDWAGAGLEIASGAAGTIPGLGTAASIGLDATLAARDLKATPTESQPSFENVVAAGGSTSTEIPSVESIGSTASPVEKLLAIVNSMFNLMSDEKQGVYTRPVDDVFNRSPDYLGRDLPRESSEPIRESFSRDKVSFKNTNAGSDSSASIQRVPTVDWTGEGILRGMTGEQTKLIAQDTARTESGGRIDAENKFGYLGKYQFGAAALVDSGLIDRGAYEEAKRRAGSNKAWFNGGQQEFLANNANWTIRGGKAAFMQDEALQDNTFLKYSNQNINAGFRSGALNRTSTPSQIAAYAKAAHLKGVGGANDYFLRGIDSTDGFGTQISKYARDAERALAPTISAAPQLANASLIEQTQAAIDQGVKYGFGSKDVRSGKIDCSGWVASINKSLLEDIQSKGEDMEGTGPAKRLFEGAAANIVENIGNVTGEVLTNEDLTLDRLREGMIIGEDNGDKGWDRGRYKGIDHVTQVVRDPTSGELMISQSSSGKGVSLMPAQDYLASKNARGTKLFGVDTTSAIDQLTAGEYTARASALKTEGPRYAESLRESKAELAQQEHEAVAPTFVAVDAGGRSSAPAPSGSGSPALTAPMKTRSDDSSIRRLTDNFMGHSMAIA